MKRVLKVSLILSVLITSLFAETEKVKTEKEKKEKELLVKVREHKKIETPAEVLKRLQKAGEEKNKTDDILNGRTNFKF